MDEAEYSWKCGNLRLVAPLFVGETACRAGLTVPPFCTVADGCPNMAVLGSRAAMIKPIAEHDVTVEYCDVEGPAMKLWCVFRDGQPLFIDARLDPAVEFARTIIRDGKCAGWLIAGGDPIRITGLPAGHARREAWAGSSYSVEHPVHWRPPSAGFRQRQDPRIDDVMVHSNKTDGALAGTRTRASSDDKTGAALANARRRGRRKKNAEPE
jgi:hypothetical protein